MAQLRVFRLGGPQVRKARSDIADLFDGREVFLCLATLPLLPLLDLRRRFKAVMNVLDGILGRQFRCPGLWTSRQWECILGICPICLSHRLICSRWLVVVLESSVGCRGASLQSQRVDSSGGGASEG